MKRLMLVLSVVLVFTMLLGACAKAPTATSTSTAAVTSTSTATVTSASTATATRTSTITLTATITITPTITPTFTPSLTPTTTLIPPESACIPSNEREISLVTRVIDGDTIEVNIGGTIYKVRYIGVDCPESGSYYSTQATNYNSTLVLNRTVILIKDQSETDQYDRLLRYVVAGNVFVNNELVKQGVAKAVAYKPDTACNQVFQTAMSTAKEAKLGFWMYTPTPAPIIYPTQPAVQPTQSYSNSNCDPSYPDVCIPSSPPDLDCGDIPYRRFRVVGSDPHNFDSDHDGIGCESG